MGCDEGKRRRRNEINEKAARGVEVETRRARPSTHQTLKQKRGTGGLRVQRSAPASHWRQSGRPSCGLIHFGCASLCASALPPAGCGLAARGYAQTGLPASPHAQLPTYYGRRGTLLQCGRQR
ncbi:hypothetical protein NDU88_001846 [Pleurodeles waltl]|uniref:Uncharacterized protein n=1 Tax=Pleurodeles waltl TaxID=8319 RepID=A0AAV7T177_PLEWA|nr:hypothetical protein NDU88_001846 [Pleurodeles waltl]